MSHKEMDIRTAPRRSGTYFVGAPASDANRDPLIQISLPFWYKIMRHDGKYQDHEREAHRCTSERTRERLLKLIEKDSDATTARVTIMVSKSAPNRQPRQ